MNELNRTKSIRLYCLDCTSGSHVAIRNCTMTDCGLHPMRMGTSPKGTQKNIVIRDYCRSCIGEAPSMCRTHDCSLFPFRSGVRTETCSISEISTKHVYFIGDEKRIGMAELRKGLAGSISR